MGLCKTMLVHKLGHYPTRFHHNGEIPPYTGPETSLLGYRACMRGGHMQAPIPTSHHTHTHMLGTHASFHLILMFSWSSFGETVMCAHSDRLPPLDVPLTGVARRSSLLFCVCLGHRVM